MTALLVALGAAVGAPLRYLTDRYVQARYGAGFPWGTLAVNVTGSLILGLVLGPGSPRWSGPGSAGRSPRTRRSPGRR
ncbi:hypothetical protein Ate01nite_52740 [Actinoplanes teichomyceticus]|nr:hypothetical protein Ate01nite_52740 [Actinoplanes teichomyceticus]